MVAGLLVPCPGGRLCGRRLPAAASPSSCHTPAAARRAGGRAPRLAVLAKAGEQQTLKVTTGSVVPWANAETQRLFQLSDKPIDWKLAKRVFALERTPKGLVALAKAELALRGADGMPPNTGMALYAASRSLGVAAWLSVAAARAGVTDARARRALGVLLSSAASKDADQISDNNAYAVVGRRLGADWAASLDGLAFDLAGLAAGLGEADFSKVKLSSKSGFDAGVDTATLEALACAAAGVVDALPEADLAQQQQQAGGGGAGKGGACAAPLLVPALREGAEEAEDGAPGGGDDAAAAAKPAPAAAAKRGFGAAAPAAAAAAPGAAPAGEARLPDFAATLRKGGRPRWPALTAFSPDGVTAEEAVAAVLDASLRLRARLALQQQPAGGADTAAADAKAAPLTLLLPDTFTASALAMGAPGMALAPGLALAPVAAAAGAAAAAAATAAAAPAAAARALFLLPLFLPQPPAARAAAVAAAAAALRGGARLLVLPVARLPRGAPRPAALDAASAAAGAVLADARAAAAATS